MFYCMGHQSMLKDKWRSDVNGMCYLCQSRQVTRDRVRHLHPLPSQQRARSDANAELAASVASHPAKGVKRLSVRPVGCNAHSWDGPASECPGCEKNFEIWRDTSDFWGEDF